MKKVNILCIDTTSEFCSVSLFENQTLIENNNSKIERSHSKLLINLVDDILINNNLKINELAAFSISKGPGSYTGLRIGLSSIKGFCYALGKPLISINTLKVLAKSALEHINDKDSILCPMIDARRMEVYTKCYNYNLNEITTDKAIILEKDSFDKLKDKSVYFFGDGAQKFIDIVNRENFIFLDNINPDSKFMGELSYDKFVINQFEDLSSFEPNYIKDFYLIKKERKMGEIVNRVKNSSLITIDVSDFYDGRERINLEISDFLDNGILIEKHFREKLKDYDWSKFNNKYVHVSSDDELIIPSWAFILTSYYLSSCCLDHVYGDLKNLDEKLYLQKIDSIDFSMYKNKKVIVKGCSDIPNFEFVYFELTKRLTPLVFSLMYGEPCSTVPIFKNKK